MDTVDCKTESDGKILKLTCQSNLVFTDAGGNQIALVCSEGRVNVSAFKVTNQYEILANTDAINHWSIETGEVQERV